MNLSRAWRKAMGSLILLSAQFFLVLRYWRLARNFHRTVGYWPRLAMPQTYREKTQWRKIFDRNPLLPRLLDKLTVKAIVHKLVPKQKFPAVLWEGTDPTSMPLELLNQPYVLKANNGCKMNVMVPAPTPGAYGQLLSSGYDFLQRQYGRRNYEWAYQEIPPRLFIEELLVTASGDPPDEYKICMMNGEPIHITVEHHSPEGPQFVYYSPDWSMLPMAVGNYEPWLHDVPRPRSLPQMLETARSIGTLVDMVRVDFYEVDGESYFGECTIYSVSGLKPLRPRRFDWEWGARWDLTQSAFFHAEVGFPQRVYRWALRVCLLVK